MGSGIYSLKCLMPEHMNAIKEVDWVPIVKSEGAHMRQMH